MPQVDVCLWNIQNYGQDSAKYNGTGTNNALRNRFIAAFVVEHQIDVLMIMEMQPGMQAALNDLVSKLNAYCAVGQKDWAYSYCGCAIADDWVDVVGGPGDLKDRTGARSECYAVLWRHNRNYFTMLRAIADIAQATSPGRNSPLNISQLGRPTGDITIGPGTYEFGAMGGFKRNQVYPYNWDDDDDDYELMDSWPKLNYPKTGNMQQIRPSWSDSRRPAYVVLQLADATNSLCPIGVYHAPSKLARASWGAFMGGLCRELYVVDNVGANNRPDPAVDPVLANFGFIGGDFNYSVDAGDWPSDYLYFTEPLGKTYQAGADQRTTPDPNAADTLRRSTVQLVTGQDHDDPITGPNTSDYLSYKIDLGFNRKIPGITAQRINLLDEVRANPNGRYNDALTNTAAFMNDLVDNLDDENERQTVTGPQRRLYKRQFGQPSWSPIISGSWGSTFISWLVARNNYAAHNITNARRAAEYIHIFVSDHLPLIATINF
jgi:hypothetical protein